MYYHIASQVRTGQRRPTQISNTSATAAPEGFDHINLNDVDDSRKPLAEGVYTLEINKLDPVYKKVTNPSSEYVGQDILVLRGSYTIVEDPTYSGRKLWQDFWTAFKAAQVNLKKQQNATGIIQQEGQTLSDYASQFATLSPPARFQVLVKLTKDRRDPTGPDVNEISWFTAKPAA